MLRGRFFERHADIKRLMQLTVSSLPIQNLNVEFLKIYDMNNVKLTLNGICLYMNSTTVLFLFELEQYIEHVFYELSQYTHSVSKKFKYFVLFLRQNCITNTAML